MFSHVFHPIHAGPSYLSQVDPRAKIIAAVALTCMIATARGIPGLFAALAGALGLVVMTRLSLRLLARRLLPLEIVLALLTAVVPWPNYGPEGFVLAAVIALKAHAAALTVAALIGTMDVVTLGHALAHLHVPGKLAQLLLVTVRYVEVLGREYSRLRTAMRVRCFRPAMDRHGYRSLGYLVGMLLVRSFDRSERVLAAMKCRGFRGHYHLLDHFHFAAWRDGPFCLAMLLLGAVILGLEWT